MKLERRKFLAQSFLASLGITTVANASPKSQPSINTCIAKPSPADALDAYKGLIPQIENQILSGIVDDLVKMSRRCSDILKDLRDKVELLKNEVDKSKKPQIQSIQNLINVGEEQVKFTNVSATSNIISIETLALVNEQVKEKLQDILPEGENVLSPNASKLINEIVKLIEESSTVQKEIDGEQKSVNEKLKNLRVHTIPITKSITKEEFSKPDYQENINVVIEKAIKSIDIATNSKSSISEVSDAKKDAENQIIKAINIIESKLKPLTVNKETALGIIKTLILALKGIQGWIANLEEISNFDLIPDNQSSQYIQTSMVKANNLLQSDFSKTIEGICGRASLENEANIITRHICVVRGLIKIRVISNTFDDKSTALLDLMTNGALYTFYYAVCDPNTARQRLAPALVKFV